MAQIKISKRTVDAAEAGVSDQFFWDTDLRGFGLKVTPRGARSYVIQYRIGGRGAPTRRYTIGAHGAPWTPDKARQRAQELLIAVKSGRDPAAEERSQRQAAISLAFDKYAEVFVESYAKRNQVRSWEQAQNTLRFNAVPRFRSKAITKIERREIAEFLEEIAAEKPATARYLHATLRKLFRWAVGRGDLPFSPMAEMPAPAPPVSRDRVLTDEELGHIWLTSRKLAFPFGAMIRLLIATGQRREEVAGMRWREIDVDRRFWTIPAARAKNGVVHDVPLNDLALLELAELRASATARSDDSKQEGQQAARKREQEDLVFSTTGTTAPSGWSKAKLRLDSLIEEQRGQPITHWRIHDLRRTFATGLQRLGIRFEVTEALLNHVSGARAGVAGVYQRHNWTAEKEAALGAWARAVERLLKDAAKGPQRYAAGNVIAISNRKAIS